MVIRTNYDYGDIVYLKTDQDQLERIVTGFIVRPNELLYSLTSCSSESTHYEFEITIEKDILKSTTN